MAGYHSNIALEGKGEMDSYTFHCLNCISGEAELVTVHGDLVKKSKSDQEIRETNFFTAPGMIDLQVNGINGVDFNSPDLTAESLISTVSYLLSKGVTSFFPTIITNSPAEIKKYLSIIDEACLLSPLVSGCVKGIHLEGPFISPEDGARGAHEAKYISPPDWDLFCDFQRAACGRIKIITIAPEYKNSQEFIKKCYDQGVFVSIGHSLAGSESVANAVKAGAKLCTHLGNAIPAMLPRHNNIIWELLAQDELYITIIADGIHLPDAFLKSVVKLKKEKAILVSDATMFAGMPAGEYTTHIGGEVVVDGKGKVSMKKSSEFLAGAAKDLLQCVQVLLDKKIVTLNDAWSMASENVITLLGKNAEYDQDWVLFQVIDSKIVIRGVVKNGSLKFFNP